MSVQNELLVGLADIYARAYPGASDPVSGVTLDTSTFTQLPEQSEDGLTETLEHEFFDLEVPSANGDVDHLLTKEGAMIEFSSIQSGLAAQLYSLPGATHTAAGVAAEKLAIGGKATEDGFLQLLFVGEDREGNSMAVFYPKVKVRGGGERQYQKKGLTLAKYSFKAFKDLTRTAGEQLRVAWKVA